MLGTFTYHNQPRFTSAPMRLRGSRTSSQNTARTSCLSTAAVPSRKNGVYDQVTAVLNATGKKRDRDCRRHAEPYRREASRGRCHGEGGQRQSDFGSRRRLGVRLFQAVSVSANCDEDPWEKYFVRFEEPSCPVIPWDACSPWPARVRK